jgi:hypothetical protein
MGHSLIRYQRGRGPVNELRVYGDDETLDKKVAGIAASLQALGVRILGVERNARRIMPPPRRDSHFTVGPEHVDCSSGACPIEFGKVAA